MRLFVSLFIVTLLISACHKEEFNTSPDVFLTFSTDTVSFDTIFTRFGSITKRFKVYNNHSQDIRISSIRLGSDNSFYRLNVNGIAKNNVENIKIGKKDSLYIFVEVTIDPGNHNNPFEIADSVIFETNGNIQYVRLRSWGQDFYYFNADVINKNTTWTNDKPYVIYNNLTVDSTSTLTISEGVRVYFHRYSSLVVRGTLLVNGSTENKVVFQGDRLEEYYHNLPSQWGTIAFIPQSKNNSIKNAIIKNSIVGIQVGSVFENDVVDLTLENVLITNISYAGIYAFGAKITAYNTITTGCQFALATLLKGGEYNFYHCTFANYNRRPFGAGKAAIIINNHVVFEEYFDPINNTVREVSFGGDLKAANFYNSIVYGNNKSEIILDNNNLRPFNYQFHNSLLKLEIDSFETSNPEFFNNCFYNEDPGFQNIDSLYYAPDSAAFIIDKADNAIIENLPILSTDILGNPRPNNQLPDLGAFEHPE